MTRRLHTATASASPDWGRYDTLVAEAMQAFSQDVAYAIQVVESARSISDKRNNSMKKNRSKP